MNREEINKSLYEAVIKIANWTEDEKIHHRIRVLEKQLNSHRDMFSYNPILYAEKGYESHYLVLLDEYKELNNKIKK